MLMISSSPAIDPDTSEGEIAHFVAVNPEQAVASRRLHNLVEFLIWSVPQCFGGGMSEDYHDAVRNGGAGNRSAPAGRRCCGIPAGAVGAPALPRPQLRLQVLEDVLQHNRVVALERLFQSAFVYLGEMTGCLDADLLHGCLLARRRWWYVG